LVAPVAAWAGSAWRVSVAECESRIGSGSLPLEVLPSAALVLRPASGDGGVIEAMAARLRALPLPVVGRIAKGALRLDLRCLEDAAPLLRGLEP
jgi:L-seryl-tRNA(Ser) seleniumtransferase